MGPAAPDRSAWFGPDQMTGSGLLVRPYEDRDATAWEAYVAAHASATVFHGLRWSRAVQDAYAHQPAHVTAWADGVLAGVLPLFLVKSLFVGRVLVSLPYATYGGILADSPDIARSILEHARQLGKDLDVQYIELRHRDASGLDLPEIGRYDTFRKELPQRPEEVLPSLPRKTRAAARKGIKALGPDSICFGAGYLDTIHDLYAVTLRRLGSPNYSRRLFRALLAHYGTDCVCMVVKSGGGAVAGVVSFVFRKEITPYFSGSLEAGMDLGANNVMYLKLMEYAVRRGLRSFDFNRSRRDNRGPHAFKRYHGFEPTPLHYQICLNKASQLPDLSPGNRKYALAGKIWRKLPLCVTRAGGARITKWIP